MSAPITISPYRLSSLLRRQKDPNLALQLFQNPNPQLQSTKPFRYSLLSYDIIITKLGRAKMFDQMEQILLQMGRETRFVPEEIIFCNVISFYGRARLPHKALQVFDQVPSFRCQRTLKSYNAVLDALLKCGEIDQMRKFLVGLGKHVNPDACTYNILINANCKSGCLDDAWNVFDTMRSKGVHPNVVTFATLISGLCSNCKLEEALRLKEDMSRVYGVKPNASVYASLIKELCKIDEFCLAFGLKDEMERGKITLGPTVYTTFISALFKVGKKDEAYRILEEMKVSGCKPDTVTYNAMIHAFCMKKDSDAAYKVLDQMVKEGCKPDIISYNVIIGGLCKEGKWSEANDLFEDLPRRGYKPDIVSYRTMFLGLCNCRRFNEAATFLDEMFFKGYAPSSEGKHKFVDGLCQEGNMELLLKVLSSLGNANLIDVDTWELVVSMACKEILSNVSERVDTILVP
ncbi:putative pentatricopeptide repeat-containing protein At1g53330 [Humulus lupulus]|uniref:putative pentatricopeptide repeat-containing protein At1g53330 n=1 Tax=Humulus lupulus TaxID=3486 RepID=UPI002B407DD1|nr:putative pentatricopeptide repeat-containing protein At1g53330 [Humulus lupulus]